MMCKIKLTTLLVIMLCVSAFSGLNGQDPVLNVNLGDDKFERFIAFEGGYMLITIDYPKAKRKPIPKVYRVRIYDHDFTLVNTINLRATDQHFLNDIRSNGQRILFNLESYDHCRLDVYDIAGERVGRKTINIPPRKALLGSDKLSMYNSGSSGFVVTHITVPERGGGNGYRIMAVDNQLESLWTKRSDKDVVIASIHEGVSRDGKWYYYAYNGNKNVNKNRDLFVAVLDTTGEETIRIDLDNAESVKVPAYLDVNMNDELTLAGEYFEGDKIRLSRTDGMFLEHHNMDGSMAWGEILLLDSAWWRRSGVEQRQ